MSEATDTATPPAKKVTSTPAKKVTSTPAKTATGKTPEEKAKEKQAKDAAAAQDRFVYTKESEGKIAPQAQVILNAIKARGARGVTREDLIKSLEGKLETTQPIGRVLSYYQKLLVEEKKCVTLGK